MSALTPLSQYPDDDFLASGDKMKELNVNGHGESLIFNRGCFDLYCVQLKNPLCSGKN